MKVARVYPESIRVFSELKKFGLLLQSDPSLPNVCELVAGEKVSGSWWAHPRSHAIFRITGELADDPDVLMAKLISGKITYLDRSLWAPVIAVGRAREPWQIERLSDAASILLAEVDRKPTEPQRGMSKAAAELEMNLLVHSKQFHTESGAHARRLESWEHWSNRLGYVEAGITAESARRALEEVVASLNRKFNGHGRLPWQR